MPLVNQDTTHSIIGAFYDVYNQLEFGFFEQIYKKALETELRPV